MTPLILENYKAIIFDMDGTMVDNMMVHHRAWQQTLKEMGLFMTLEEVKEKVHGINEEILERLFGDRFTPEERKRFAYTKESNYRELFIDSLVLIAGLETFMNTVRKKKIPMAVGSAAPVENVDFVLDNLNIRSHFQVVLHAGDVSKGKPDPEIYLKIMKLLKVNPSETLIFEDSVVGATAAENAGCDVMVVTTTHQPDEFIELKNVIGTIHDFTEIQLLSYKNINE